MAILAFHNVDDTFPLGVNYYPPNRLRNLLIHLRNSGYTFLPLNEYLKLDCNQNAISLTFDDGYRTFYEKVWPLLSEHSVPAAIFMPLNWVGKSNNWDYMSLLRESAHLNRAQLRGLASNNIEIGSHGLNHKSLAGISDRILRVELEHSRKGLEDIIGRPVRYLSYPFGRYDERTERFALQAGYERGFSLSYFSKGRQGFTLPRHSIYYFDSPFSVMQKIERCPLNHLEKIKGAIINSYSYGTILLNKIRPQRLLRKP